MKIKLADFLGRMNARYEARVTYQQLYMGAISGRIPAERDATGRFWVVDETDESRIAKSLGLGPAKSKNKPKPAAKPAAKKKPGAARPARSRAPRSAA
jgi:hypothetical protein